jgi:hypothetical protein
MSKQRIDIMTALMEIIKAANRYVAISSDRGGPLSKQEFDRVIAATTRVSLEYAKAGYKFEDKEVQTPFGMRKLLWPIGVDDPSKVIA